MKGLVLELQGIFGFFRVPFNALLMDTYHFPPKTTAIGMLGAALGWDENTFLSYLKKIKYGVIIEKPGSRASETTVIFKSSNSPTYPITKNLLYKPEFKVFFVSEGEPEVIEEAYRALYDPAYVLALGDSENLVYPGRKDYASIMDVAPAETERVRCILPSDIFTEFKERIDISSTEKGHEVIPPKEIKIPVDFTGKGKKRRFIPKGVYYYSGVEIVLKEPVSAYDFSGEKVYLF